MAQEVERLAAVGVRSSSPVQTPCAPLAKCVWGGGRKRKKKVTPLDGTKYQRSDLLGMGVHETGACRTAYADWKIA